MLTSYHFVFIYTFKGYIKGGRTLRRLGHNTDEFNMSTKRERNASKEVEDNDDSLSDDERIIVKKRRSMKMEASPEVSDSE